ncbi:DUF4097 family beta strand repeat-containing protein [Streptomyces sp. enrichment culture]|uniref:DUF4097 family beta strand repeat-containing protein n=1 Tax=Streptomyces sp. enrichment culture TaxID=1795815 RepID=UPI003F560291
MYEFTADTPATARIRVPGGRCAVRAGTGRRITVTVAPWVRLSRTDRQAADNTAVTYEDGVLTVTAPAAGAAVLRTRPGLRLDVTLPAGSTLEFGSESADLDVRGDIAGLTADTGTGDVDVEDVTGDVRLGSTSGDVRLGTIVGSLSYRTDSGDLRVRGVVGSVHGDSASGDAFIGATEGEVEIGSVSGDLRISEARAGTIRATTSSGDVTVKVENGVEVRESLTTGSGDRHSDLGKGGASPEGAGELTLDITTKSGDITVRRV